MLAEVSETLSASGPMTPDNPFAVAFAFWRAILTDNYSDLGIFVTPESRGVWNLSELRKRTENGGLATGVMKPCYDVAYVRILTKDVPNTSTGTLEIAGGLMLADAMIISLVLRPELGGWRVHGLGYPLDSDELPRTWKLDCHA